MIDEILIPAWIDEELRPVEKLKVHQLGLKHQAVSVFLIDPKRNVLMQQRAMEKYHTPGLWANTCCTHPNWNEDPKTCALRRLTEELGIKSVNLKSVGQIEYRADVGNQLIEHEVVDLFVGKVLQDIEMSINPSEVLSTCWISLDDLVKQIETRPDNFTPWIKIYMKEYASKIF